MEDAGAGGGFGSESSGSSQRDFSSESGAGLRDMMDRLDALSQSIENAKATEQAVADLGIEREQERPGRFGVGQVAAAKDLYSIEGGFQNRGLGSFFKNLGINVARKAPGTAVSLVTQSQPLGMFANVFTGPFIDKMLNLPPEEINRNAVLRTPPGRVLSTVRTGIDKANTFAKNTLGMPGNPGGPQFSDDPASTVGPEDIGVRDVVPDQTSVALRRPEFQMPGTSREELLRWARNAARGII